MMKRTLLDTQLNMNIVNLRYQHQLLGYDDFYKHQIHHALNENLFISTQSKF